MNLTYESVGVIVANDDLGIITIDNFAHLNEKYVDDICRILLRPGEITGGVSNPGFAVSEMAEANLQEMIYYIKHFKRIRRTCTHAAVELDKVCAMYNQRDMEESYKDP